jgi:hypothetical protein
LDERSEVVVASLTNWVHNCPNIRLRSFMLAFIPKHRVPDIYKVSAKVL